MTLKRRIFISNQNPDLRDAPRRAVVLGFRRWALADAQGQSHNFASEYAQIEGALRGAKMPADLGGNIFLELADKNDTRPIESAIRDFVEQRL